MRRAAMVLLLAATACSAGRGERAAERPAARAVAGPDLPLGEVPPQRLARGQCALALWSRTTPARRVFLGVNEPASARVQLGGRTVTLPRTGVSGEPAFGHHPTQTYTGEGVSLTVAIELDAREGLIGGAAAPSASLTLRDAAGLETVIPAAGLVACQS